jgi:hypothetical protein
VRDIPSKGIATYNYRKTGRIHESYRTRPYTLNNLGEIILRPDWEDHVGAHTQNNNKRKQASEEPVQKKLSFTESDNSDIPEGLSHKTLFKLRYFRHNPKTAMLANIDKPRLPDPSFYKEIINSLEGPL